MTDYVEEARAKGTKPLDIVAAEEAVEQRQHEGRIEFAADMRLKLDFGGSKNRLIEIFDGEEILIGRKLPSTGLHQVDRVDLDPYFAAEFGVSRKHVTIRRAGNRLFVTDLASTNGTYLNHARITPGEPTLLREGDLLRLGLFEITIRFVG